MLNQVKHDLHAMMNGVLAQQLRERGIRYRIIYGVELPRLEQYAAELSQELPTPQTRYDLAQALWKTETRECRLLTPMLMPPELLLPEVADIWVEQIHTQEEATCMVHYLLSKTSFASDKAFQWMASEVEMTQQCGFLLIARLMRQGGELAVRDESELIDQAEVSLQSHNLMLRKAAYNALLCLSEKGLRQERLIESVLKRNGL